MGRREKETGGVERGGGGRRRWLYRIGKERIVMSWSRMKEEKEGRRGGFGFFVCLFLRKKRQRNGW